MKPFQTTSLNFVLRLYNVQAQLTSTYFMPSKMNINISMIINMTFCFPETAAVYDSFFSTEIVTTSYYYQSD